MHIFEDIKVTLPYYRYILYSSFLKIRLRNAGSNLGLIWEPLSTVLVSVVLSLVWARVLEVEDSVTSYFVYVYTGMVIWGWLAGSVSNLCATLTKNSAKIVNRKMPLFSYLFEDIAVSVIPFLISLPLVIPVSLILGSSLTVVGVMQFMLGCVLVLLTCFAFSLSVGLLAFFIGDIRQLVTAVMRLSFLITPVIWRPDRLGIHADWLLLNPFVGYLHILRGGLLGEPLMISFVCQALFCTVSLLFFASVLFTLTRSRIQARALAI